MDFKSHVSLANRVTHPEVTATIRLTILGSTPLASDFEGLVKSSVLTAGLRSPCQEQDLRPLTGSVRAAF